MPESEIAVPNKRGSLSREVVLDAALDIVVSEGHEALSLRRLAKDFGVTAPSLYGYVETKEELLGAVASIGYDDLTSSIESVDADTPSDRIRGVARVYLAFARANPELWQLMNTFSFASRPGAGDDTVTQGGRAFQAAARSVFEAMSCGEMRLGDPWLTAVAFRSAIHGVARLCVNGSSLSEAEEDAILDVVVESMLAGLAPTASATPKEPN